MGFARAPRLLVALAPAPLAVVAACEDGTSRAAGLADGADSGGARGDRSEAGEGGAAADAKPESTCAITRAYFEGCDDGADLNCGSSGFDAWCAANDEAINSEAYRRAEALCLTQDNCDGDERRACEYEHYNGETPTAAQKALVEGYCETCEPSDVAGCTKRSTTYESAKGIDSVSDVFVAAWELADDVTAEITTKCTGAAATDAGSDVTACAQAFAGCAADVYLAHLPDCPN